MNTSTSDASTGSKPPPVDPALAGDVKKALQALISKLQSQMSTRVTRAQTMQQTWTGPYADQFFGTEVPRMKKQTTDLIAQLQSWVTTIDGATSGR
jgi:uncharacterized protein YukE